MRRMSCWVMNVMMTKRSDERTQKHNCLKDWDELDRESEKASSPEWLCDYKSYDFSVVNTSIALSTKDEGNISD